MDSISLQLYMGNDKEVVAWLKKKGVKYREEAQEMLTPYAREAFRSSVGVKGSSIAGLAYGSERIMKAFPEKPVPVLTKVEQEMFLCIFDEADAGVDMVYLRAQWKSNPLKCKEKAEDVVKRVVKKGFAEIRRGYYHITKGLGGNLILKLEKEMFGD